MLEIENNREIISDICFALLYLNFIHSLSLCALSLNLFPFFSFSGSILGDFNCGNNIIPQEDSSKC